MAIAFLFSPDEKDPALLVSLRFVEGEGLYTITKGDKLLFQGEAYKIQTSTLASVISWLWQFHGQIAHENETEVADVRGLIEKALTELVPVQSDRIFTVTPLYKANPYAIEGLDVELEKALGKQLYKE